LPLGAAVDRYGLRPVGRLGFVVLLAGGGLTVIAWSFPVLLAARFAAGLGGALGLLAGLRGLSTHVPPAPLGAAFGGVIAWLAHRYRPRLRRAQPPGLLAGEHPGRAGRGRARGRRVLAAGSARRAARAAARAARDAEHPRSPDPALAEPAGRRRLHRDPGVPH